nr:reverse transcriptase domain-containing protein [Tanacetum cinerariifolium]GEV27697.1 reverse transcriptase domain-containing protein [Tanacetum cinerariifolium]
MAAPVISISSNITVESVRSSFSRVILIGSISVKVLVAPEALTARKSVRPLPYQHLALRYTSHHLDHFTSGSSSSNSSSDHSSSGHSSLGHSLSEHTPPDTTNADSSTSPRFFNPPLARTLWCGEAYLRWRYASQSTMYPPMTSESLAGDSSFELSAGPSRKRCRSPTATMISSIHATRTLFPFRVDLLPLASDRDVEAGIDAGNGMEVDVEVDVKDEVEDEVDYNDRGTIEVGVDMVVGFDIYDGMLMPDVVEHLEQRESEARSLIPLLEQVMSLERSNMRLQGIMMMERARDDRMRSRRLETFANMTITRSGMTPEATKELINRRVEKTLATYEATHAATALEAENQSQNGSDSDNRNEGNGNGGNGNKNENDKGARLVARECTIIRIEVAFAMSWKEVMKLMAEVYYLRNEIQKMESELLNLTVKNNDMVACTQRFQELTMMCTKMVPEEEDRVEKFIRARGKAHVLGGGDANPDLNVIKGMFLLNNHYAFVLFDSGADRSFVSTTFSTLLDITPDTLDVNYAIELANERVSKTNTILRGYTLGLLGHPFNIDLMPVELGSLTSSSAWIDLSGLPPTRQVEFQIDLVSGAASVARVPYRLSPSEQQELSIQLQELSEKGFPRPKFRRKTFQRQRLEHATVTMSSSDAVGTDKHTDSIHRSDESGIENFMIYCDASHKGLDTVLIQKEKFIAYTSRQLKIHERNYTTHEMELGAIVFALKMILNAQVKAIKEENFGTKDLCGMIKKLERHTNRTLCLNGGSWIPVEAEVRDAYLTGPEIVHETTKKIIHIKKHIQAARDRQKSYADRARKPLEFKVRDKVMLKVSPWKWVIHFGKRGKLNPLYIRPFKILAKVGMLAY